MKFCVGCDSEVHIICKQEKHKKVTRMKAGIFDNFFRFFFKTCFSNSDKCNSPNKKW